MYAKLYLSYFSTTKSTSSVEDTGAGDVATKSITQMTDKEVLLIVLNAYND